MKKKIRKDLRAAFGGRGWRPRNMSLQQELGSIWAACGITTEWAPLKSVLLHRPGLELQAFTDPDAVQMLAPLDVLRAQNQHDALADTYRRLGVAVHDLDAPETSFPNQMFMADLFFATPQGMILARPASEVRAGEERHAARKLAAMGIPLVRSISGAATFEGADAMWLNEREVMIGRGLRTNAQGATQVAAVLDEMGVRAITIDLPPHAMHLMGLLRIVDRHLAIAWPGRFPEAGLETLQRARIRVEFIPDTSEAMNGFAMNVVTIRPKEIVMPAGNPHTRAFFEKLGIRTHTVAVDELGKAAGAIGCLTGVLEREKLSGDDPDYS
ncbi:MAG: arginine deiminase family protein [Acidobacteriota bacterium]|nr:arginine deiminase family protein [Acidobacteriota bacterium]